MNGLSVSCVGCGAESSAHPYVGIGKDGHHEIQALPVCEACWRDPAHRTRQLKMHFFTASVAGRALSAARAMDERSQRGEDLVL